MIVIHLIRYDQCCIRHILSISFHCFRRNYCRLPIVASFVHRCCYRFPSILIRPKTTDATFSSTRAPPAGDPDSAAVSSTIVHLPWLRNLLPSSTLLLSSGPHPYNGGLPPREIVYTSAMAVEVDLVERRSQLLAMAKPRSKTTATVIPAIIIINDIHGKCVFLLFEGSSRMMIFGTGSGRRTRPGGGAGRGLAAGTGSVSARSGFVSADVPVPPPGTTASVPEDDDTGTLLSGFCTAPGAIANGLLAPLPTGNAGGAGRVNGRIPITCPEEPGPGLGVELELPDKDKPPPGLGAGSSLFSSSRISLRVGNTIQSCAGRHALTILNSKT